MLKFLVLTIYRERPNNCLSLFDKTLNPTNGETGADPGFQKGGWMADHIY